MITETEEFRVTGGCSYWPVCWSGVIVGALAAVALVMIFGLIGLALGAHLMGPSRAVLDWKTMAWSAVIFNVCGAFFSFVAGGWIAVKVANLTRSEPSMMHGGIVWLVAIPLLVFLVAQGASNYMGGWYGGLASSNPAWSGVTSTELSNVSAVDARTVPGQAKLQSGADIDAARAARNTAVGAAAALLLGLMGSVLGGWMASGEPMTLTHWRTREEKLAMA